MMPICKINVGDIYSDPLHRGYGEFSGDEFHVIEKCEDMVKVQAVSYKTLELVGSPVWKKHTDRMFCESWRVFDYDAFINRKEK